MSRADKKMAMERWNTVVEWDQPVSTDDARLLLWHR